LFPAPSRTACLEGHWWIGRRIATAELKTEGPEPGRVSDRTVDLDGVPDGYRAMNDRESIKVLVAP
jgi:hypothetical protein